MQAVVAHCPATCGEPPAAAEGADKPGTIPHPDGSDRVDLGACDDWKNLNDLGEVNWCDSSLLAADGSLTDMTGTYSAAEIDPGSGRERGEGARGAHSSFHENCEVRARLDNRQ